MILYLSTPKEETTKSTSLFVTFPFLGEEKDITNTNKTLFILY